MVYDLKCFITVYFHLLPLTVFVFGSWVRTPAVVLISGFFSVWSLDSTLLTLFCAQDGHVHNRDYVPPPGLRMCSFLLIHTPLSPLWRWHTIFSFAGPSLPKSPSSHPSPPPPQSIGLNTLKWGAPYAWKKTDLSKLSRPLSCLVVATLGFIYHAFVHVTGTVRPS